jgi:superfamily II DNA or RNA helicase
MSSSSNRSSTSSPPTPGAPSRALRPWQVEALEKYESSDPEDFLATATPGAGKTTFALALAGRLKARRQIDRLVVVVPTDHLRTQWADAAASVGLVLDPKLANSVGPVRPGFDGYVTTYAQVAGRPMLHRARTEARRSLVVLDEIHHAGDARSWGEAAQEAFGTARRRLSLTGTPFRTKPDERIPFVSYAEVTAGELVSEADYSYGYREALADAVVRPVVFAAYTGTSRWMNSAGEVLSASLTDPANRRQEDAAWRTALDPQGGWIPHVIAAADQRLSDVRQSSTPDAAGLLLATDQDTARAYAKVVTKVTGHRPVLALSDDPRSSKKIAAFGAGDERWIVAVRQVSEGVDIPRLSLCVWATSYRTPLFFAQAVGRVVRARSRAETATVFLPAVRPLLALAASMEEQRHHVVQIRSEVEGGLDVDPVDRPDADAGEQPFTALGAEAEFAHLLHGGRAITPELSAADQDFVGLPGLLTPEQTASLLASRDAQLRRPAAEGPGPATEGPGPSAGSWRSVEDLRREIHQLVGQRAARSGRRHAEVHLEIRRAVAGPPSATAPVDVLVSRRDWLLGSLLDGGTPAGR